MTRLVGRRRFRVSGVVQGVGFRPFVHALAAGLGLSGFVGNDADGVFLEAQGPTESLVELERRIRDEAPPLAVVDSVTVEVLEPIGREGIDPGPIDTGPSAAAGTSSPAHGAGAFRIVGSGDGEGVTSIPPDTAVCGACLAELRDPADRRFGYPFIACTHCGPRYTITTGLPYDRANTTMAGFPLCPPCLAEYTDPASRRFHAQPTACAACGPRMSMPVDEMVAALRAGLIVAVKGIGGYHLACDARDAAAVRTLRTRKQRGAKPFALMAADLDSARGVAVLDETAEALLTSPARPIVILAGLDADLVADVAPGTGTLGVMLPYAPLHHLLFDAGAPDLLVMTSGNLADEPICIDSAEAEQRLAGLADVFVHHDRPIHVACDDSVTRVVSGSPQPVRRSRGYAPMPLALPVAGPPMLAVGGELKTTVCVARGATAWLSQHIGDTANLETLAMLERTVRDVVRAATGQPGGDRVRRAPRLPVPAMGGRAGDGPGDRAPARRAPPCSPASLLAEHRVPVGEPVLGVVLDGTGYGADATIWGGELLLGSLRGRREGRTPAPGLPARWGCRDPASLADGGGTPARLRARLGGHRECRRLHPGRGRRARPDAGHRIALHAHDEHGSAVRRGRVAARRAPRGGLRGAGRDRAGGAGRLDRRRGIGLACLLGPSTVRWCAPTSRAGSSSTPPAGSPRQWPTMPAGVDPATSSRAFHLALAEALTEAVLIVHDLHGIDTVGLTGGVFANAVLSSACQGSLRRAGLTVLVHGVVPPNDGGLALGQAAVAAAWSAR